jgi:hypothetical protein
MSFRTAVLAVCALGLFAGVSGAPPAAKHTGEAGNIRKSWFLGVHAVGSEVKTVPLGAASKDSLRVRYGLIWDSGVEIDRVSENGTVIWRCQVEPLYVEHSRYRHHVKAQVSGHQLKIESVGRKTILATIDVETGKQLTRSVVENVK